MEIYTKTTTAWMPSFGMSTLGRPCTHVRVSGAAVVNVQADVAAIARLKGDFPGSDASSPPTS